MSSEEEESRAVQFLEISFLSKNLSFQAESAYEDEPSAGLQVKICSIYDFQKTRNVKLMVSHHQSH